MSVQLSSRRRIDWLSLAIDWSPQIDDWGSAKYLSTTILFIFENTPLVNNVMDLLLPLSINSCWACVKI